MTHETRSAQWALLGTGPYLDQVPYIWQKDVAKIFKVPGAQRDGNPARQKHGQKHSQAAEAFSTILAPPPLASQPKCRIRKIPIF